MTTVPPSPPSPPPDGDAAPPARARRTPRYEQICEELIGEIQGGAFKAHDQFLRLDDIGRRFGVSHITAQRVLKELAQRGLIYTRQGSGSFIAPRPRRGATGLVSYLGWAFSPLDAIGPPVIHGAEAVARERGYHLIFSNSQSELDQMVGTVGSLLRQQVDGVLFDVPIDAGPFHTNRAYDSLRRLEDAGIPTVQVHKRFLDVKPTAYVGAANYAGVRQLVEHLAGLGHQRIAGLFETNTSSSLERMEGLRGGVLGAGLTYHPDYLKIFESPGDFPRLLEELLAMALPPTALVCEHDLVARDVCALLQGRGLAVPADISVVGFDDQPFCGYLNPPLTTVRQPLEAMGREAMRVLLHRIEEQFDYHPQALLPTELVVRGSTAPPPKGA